MNRYLVMVMRLPQFDTEQIGPHREFLDGLRAQARLELSGGFGDKTGGAYILRAVDLEEARANRCPDFAVGCAGRCTRSSAWPCWARSRSARCTT